MSDGRDYGPILEALWTQVIECRRLPGRSTGRGGAQRRRAHLCIVGRIALRLCRAGLNRFGLNIEAIAKTRVFTSVF